MAAILCALASLREAFIWIDLRRPVVKGWSSRRLRGDLESKISDFKSQIETCVQFR